MPRDAWLPFCLFMAVVLAVSLYGLAVSGQFPREHRKPDLRSGAGALILLGSIAVVALSFSAGIVLAWRTVPWYAVIIGGGLVLLMTPLLLRPLPDRFVNGRGALIAFAGAAALLALALAWSG